MIRPGISIIDDDIAVVSLLCQIVDSRGWLVPRPDGVTALTALEVRRPDVVVLKIALDTPDRGGRSFPHIHRGVSVILLVTYRPGQGRGRAGIRSHLQSRSMTDGDPGGR